MKFIKNNYVGIIIFIELVSILIVGRYIYTKLALKKNVLGAAAVMPLSKENYQSTASGNLKYFYEPNANTKVIQSPIAWLDKKVTYNFNSDTFNDLHDYSIEKPANTFRILALGDSHTFGAYVNTAENYPSLLEDKLNTLKCGSITKFEVINLGVGGYGPEYIKERYKLRGMKYNPDLIIWYESRVDYDRVNELFTPILNDIQSKMTPKEIKDDLDKGVYTAWVNAYKELYKRYTADELHQMVGNSWKEFYSLRGNTKVLVMAHSSDEHRGLLKEWASGQDNVSFLDLPGFDNAFGMFPDGHPNEKGYQTIVKSVFDYLKENFFTSCTQ